MDRVLYRKAVMVYKSLNGLAQAYMQDMFKYVTYVNLRSTCNADKSKLYLPGGKKMKKYRKLLLLNWHDMEYHAI